MSGRPTSCFDATASPTVLFDVEIGGKLHHGIAEAEKTGWLYMLDRESGKPLLPIPEKAVPQDANQKTAATQPIPSYPPFISHTPTKAQVADITKRAKGAKPLPVEGAQDIMLRRLDVDRRQPRLHRAQQRRAPGLRREDRRGALVVPDRRGRQLGPSVFEQDGKEYLAFLAGGNAIAASAHGDNLWLLLARRGARAGQGRGCPARASATRARPCRAPTTKGGDATEGQAVFAATRVTAQVENGGGGMPRFKARATRRRSATWPPTSRRRSPSSRSGA